MYAIKQSTAITVPFFVHDANGDAVTGLTNPSFTKRISKNGGAFGAMTVTITEMENGWYSIPLSTAHSNTLGLLTVVFTNAGAKQVNLQWRVEANLNDDLSTDIATVDTVVDGIQADLDNGTDGLGAIKADTAAILVDTADMQPKLGTPAADVSADIAAIKAETALIVADTNELQTDDVPGLIAALNDLSAAQVNTEVDSAIVTYGLDHLVQTSVIGTDVANNSIMARLVSSSATADWDDFVNTTDSLQATRDAITTVDTVVDGIQADLDNGTDGLGAIKGDTAAILVDTADMQPKLGTPAADISADVAAVKAETALIVADTSELQGDWTNGGRLDLIIDAILADTAVLPASFPTNFADMAVEATTGLVSVNVKEINDVTVIGVGTSGDLWRA